jgi:hypothetical protein
MQGWTTVDAHAGRCLRSNAGTGSFLVLVALVAGVQPAFAQGWTGRGRVSLNVGAQFDTKRLSESITLSKHAESAPVAAEAPEATLPVLDVGVVLRLAGNLGAGVSVSYLTNRSEAQVSAQIPHPFYFDQRRSIGGTVSGVLHEELAVHTDLAYLVALRRIDFILSGGASFFRLEQSFVSDVIFAEAYPYDTASFVTATLAADRASKVGYNAGADVTWKFSPRWGLGGLIRFSRARVPLAIGELDAGTVEVGGLQAGGGLRVIF